MNGLSTRLPCKNAPLWCPPLTSQSPCRGPSGRINSPCRRPTETRRLWNNAYSGCSRAPNKRAKLSVYYLCALRNHHDRLYLPAPDRPKIPHCLLISEPHGPSGWGNFNSNPLRIHRGHYPNDCPWTNILRPLLPGQH